MWSISRLVVLVALAVMGSTGCMGGSPPEGTGEFSGADPVSQVEQAVTGCELDCPSGGPILTCAAPCSVPDANTLICNGVTQHCCWPHSCDGACGLQSDGCGHTLDCGPCGTECPRGQVDCCGDGVCMVPTACRKTVCDPPL